MKKLFFVGVLLVAIGMSGCAVPYHDGVSVYGSSYSNGYIAPGGARYYQYGSPTPYYPPIIMPVPPYYSPGMYSPYGGGGSSFNFQYYDRRDDRHHHHRDDRRHHRW